MPSADASAIAAAHDEAEERAAIREFEGGATRAEAEAATLAELRLSCGEALAGWPRGR